MTKRASLTWAAATLAVVGGVGAAVPASASPGGGACTLAGQATFNGSGPGSNPSATWSYGFTGKLANCQASPGAPAELNGVVSAGAPVTFIDHGTGTTAGTPVTDTGPAATGAGSCASSTTAGIAFVEWNADPTQTTILQYSTTGAGPLVVQNGTPYGQSGTATYGVLSSYTFPDGKVIKTTVYAPGDGGLGALVFQPPSPTDCTAASGVTTAALTGVVGLGGTS